MPLTGKGKEIFSAMTRPPSEGGYGKKKGEQVFYASANKGTITGVHDEDTILPLGDDAGDEVHTANRRSRMHAALDRVIDRKHGKRHAAKDAPAEFYDPAQSRAGRNAIRERLHRTLDRCIDAVRDRRKK